MAAESNRARLFQELTTKSPDMSIRGRWIMLEKSVPHDMVSSPHTAKMFIGHMIDSVVVRIVSSSPLEQGSKPQIYAFDMTLPNEKHGLEIQYIQPSEKEAQQFALVISDPDYPLAYLRDVLKLGSLNIEGDNVQNVRLLYNGILDVLLPEKLDLDKACGIIQQAMSIDRTTAQELIESVKRARVKAKANDGSDSTPFFDPARYARS